MLVGATPYGKPIRIEDFPESDNLRRIAKQVGKDGPLTWNEMASRSSSLYLR